MPPSRSSGHKRPQASELTASKRLWAKGFVPREGERSVKEDIHHLKKIDIPDDASQIRSLALEMHLRVLMGAVTNTSVPEAPDNHTLNTFSQCFTSAGKINALLKGNIHNAWFQATDKVALDAIIELRRQCNVVPDSNIALNIASIPEHDLQLIFLKVHSFGLPAWCPNLLGGTHTSLYNGALESIAIWTFEQAATTFAYQHLALNLAYLQNRPVLEKLYCNFMWGYMKKLAAKEAKEKGSVCGGVEENKAYKNCQLLTPKHHTYLKDHGWNQHIRLLAGSYECTSDDERNPDGGFFIMRKQAHNPHITDFLHHIDNSRKAGNPLFHGSRRREEPCIPHPENLESQISAHVPVDCPLDWFDPAFFNAMLLRNCAHYATAPIALPLKSDCLSTDSDPDWKDMPRCAFMKKYGNCVWALYKLPTATELVALEDGEEEEEENEQGKQEQMQA
ncbi:hypothetical protein L208DRAFT_1333258 [Tricholoma matsutake]|nr:hypothetical protein L208DRAFT_1333258 [Tricholoma matsutake 945]